MPENKHGNEKDTEAALKEAITYVGGSAVGTFLSYLVAVSAKNKARAHHPEWTSAEIDADYYENMFDYGPYLAATIAYGTTALSLCVAISSLASLFIHLRRR